MPTALLRNAALRCTIACVTVTLLTLTPVEGMTQEGPKATAMILYGNAPTLEFGNGSYSGSGIAIAGDLLLGPRWVGRVQADMLQASSLSGPDAERVRGGLAFVGSLGYRLRFPTVPRLSIDLLAHFGYAQVTYNNGNADFTDASPQAGVGIAPHISMSDRFGITFAVRTLKGSAVGEGTAINRTDISVGGRLALF